MAGAHSHTNLGEEVTFAVEPQRISDHFEHDHDRITIGRAEAIEPGKPYSLRDVVLLDVNGMPVWISLDDARFLAEVLASAAEADDVEGAAS